MVNATLISEAQLFAQRLRASMVNSGLKPSPTVLSHEFNLNYWGQGISVHAARNWLLGKSLPTQDKLVVLAKCLKVDASELRFGNISSAQAGVALDGLGSLNMQDRAMLFAYLKLDEAKQRVLRELVHVL